MSKSKLIAVVATLVVLLLMPQALAVVTSGFGGSSGTGSAGKSESMSLQSSDSFASQETLSFGSGVSMESTGKVSLDSEEGWLDQYHEVASPDGKLHAATYAFMVEP